MLLKTKHRYLTYVGILIITVVLTNADELSLWLTKKLLLDKVGHFISFFLLTWLLDKIISLPRAVLVLSVICYAGFTELCQWYLGFRSPQFYDFIANALGCLSYYIVATALSLDISKKS
ncbi:VanZ family protein [Thalassotalea ponticola]|uniref:VanZ family protein n=1 Tax=Thalassotalea ponticola TaxID=1523392 RepID=UPI0025B32E59|nr:VanZ family protein [Thalassotalea ponticola]MDN3653148.1 VanZ family protein [Thalassotalea ponticola]